jgi:hypothetical protein
VFPDFVREVLRVDLDDSLIGESDARVLLPERLPEHFLSFLVIDFSSALTEFIDHFLGPDNQVAPRVIGTVIESGVGRNLDNRRTLLPIPRWDGRAASGLRGSASFLKPFFQCRQVPFNRECFERPPVSPCGNPV